MVIHPPMLYMGYVGLSVAFAFAVAALIGGNLDATWARWTRPWTTAAWIFLTLGIALGSGWAYYELGWGGWWFWDPVENASFMPWLVGDRADPFARRHREARRLQVVDGAARDPRVLAVAARHLPGPLRRAVVGARLRHRSEPRPLHPRLPRRRHRLVARACTPGARRRVGLGARFALLSRESLLLANNVLLVVACGAVLLGTLYPLALDAHEPGQDLGRAAVLRHRLRAAADAARLPDGRRPAGALEAGRAARPRDAAALGRRRRGRGDPASPPGSRAASASSPRPAC